MDHSGADISAVHTANERDSWEDCDELELFNSRRVGELDVHLQDGATRRVFAEWFEPLRDTPLHAILFDTRWGGKRGEVQTTSNVFDDIVAFVRFGVLPEEHPRSRRRRLREAADFYCLEELTEELDVVEARDAAAREKIAAKEAADAKRLAAREKQLRRAAWQSRRGNVDRAAGMMQDFETWSLRHDSKALTTKSMLHSVQQACNGAGGPQRGYNHQRVTCGTNLPKRDRFA